MAGKIFINYRRDCRVFDRLESEFGSKQALWT
jgi:hypothetical protein